MNDLLSTGFLACRDCGVLQTVLLHASIWSDDMVEDAFRTCDEFLAEHGAHRIAWFQRHGVDCVADRPLWDPMATITFEVSDGQDSYIATSARESIDAERVYRFVPGSLQLRQSQISLDEQSLQRALDLQFYPHALRPTKVARLLSVLHEVVGQINPDDVAIAFDEADDPAVSIGRMPDASFDELLARAAEIFDSWELARITDFLRDNRNEDGLLALRVRRHIATLAA